MEAPAKKRAASGPGKEAELVARLQDGDEGAFEELVDRYHGMFLGVARNYVRGSAVAEEVVQEAWIGVLNGLDRFEGRSSLKNWMLRIVVNTAISRGTREARSLPFSSLTLEDEEAAIEPERFRAPNGAFPGHWNSYPGDWSSLPDQVLLGRETIDVVKDAVDQLPPAQRQVITLRDLAGWPADEVCATLDISDGNQRILLHRARSRVRAALERHLDD